jgi:hypothetical protein
VNFVNVDTVPTGCEVETRCGCRYIVKGGLRSTKWGGLHRAIKVTKTCEPHSVLSISESKEVGTGSYWSIVHYDPLAVALDECFG